MIDTSRMLVSPRDRHGGNTIGMRARSYEIAHTGWRPAWQYAWILLRVTEVHWYAEISLDIQSRNALHHTSIKQWVPHDAVRLPTAQELDSWH